MFRFIRFCTIVAFVITGMVASPALACIPDEGHQDSGAAYQIYFPDNWNGDLVVFAHSYVFPPGSPLKIDEEELVLMVKFSGHDLSAGCIYRNGICLRGHEL